MPIDHRTSGILACGLLSLALAGCGRVPLDGGPLTIASSWTETERDEIEGEFNHWLAARSGTGVPKGGIAWVVLDRGDRLEPLVKAERGPSLLRRRLDLALGGPLSDYIMLAQANMLARPDEGHDSRWRIVRRSPIGWLVRSENTRKPPSERTLAFDDPRHVPLALAWAKGRLSAGPWSEGYGGLVRDAGRARLIGRQAGAAQAAVERGSVDAAPAKAIPPEGPAPEWVEGVAILAGGDNLALARLFLAFLAERGQAEPPSPALIKESERDDLLADLLGATLVDAHDELRAAWNALPRARDRARFEAWMTEPPPWPPASVEKLLAPHDEASAELLEALAGQIAPDPDVRAWLRRSWLGPKRSVDARLLGELAEALDGRLAREPRFRAWLRAEWTAWARQRYRRVARVAEGRWP